MLNKFLKIIEVSEVEKILKDLFNDLYSNHKSENVELECANHRVLAENINATMDLPPFDRASKDGFAVHAPDTFGATEEEPVILDLLEHIDAGQRPQKKIKPGYCSLINTGAPIPEGASGVVMVEYTETRGKKIEIYRPAAPGQFITKQGSDIKQGDRLLSKGTFITSDKIGALSAMGLKKYQYKKKLRWPLFQLEKSWLILGRMDAIIHEVVALFVTHLVDLFIVPQVDNANVPLLRDV